ncbi:MAG: lipoate--protein ligase family protein [Pirellulaceae bacterium]
MQLLDLTLPTLAENLALDEALLEEAEAGGEAADVLRLWESSEVGVVIGRASKVDEEVDREACRRLGVSVHRRTSGGAAVLVGPGCLMYSVVLAYQRHPPLRIINEAHRHVLGALCAALRSVAPGVEAAGTSDLILEGRKFSGNSLRCKRDHLLYHGTLLYDFPLDRISTCLRMPPRQPDYREGREHTSFVTNIPLTNRLLREAIAAGWPIEGERTEWPRRRTRELVETRYALDEWNLQR